MIYILVLFGSLIGLCVLLGARLIQRNRAVRKFVRGIKSRSDTAADRAGITDETDIGRAKRPGRISAIELQQVRTFVCKAEKEFARGNFDEVERCYIQALTIDPDAYEIQAEIAKLYLLTGREAKAEALYKEILNVCDDVSCYSNLGLSYYQQGKYSEACKAYGKALEKDPANAERQFSLGRACIAAQRFKDAAPLLEKASTRLSRNIELLYMLADCYMKLGFKEHAENAYRRINKIEPYNEEVKEKLIALAN